MLNADFAVVFSLQLKFNKLLNMQYCLSRFCFLILVIGIVFNAL